MATLYCRGQYCNSFLVVNASQYHPTWPKSIMMFLIILIESHISLLSVFAEASKQHSSASDKRLIMADQAWQCGLHAKPKGSGCEAVSPATGFSQLWTMTCLGIGFNTLKPPWMLHLHKCIWPIFRANTTIGKHAISGPYGTLFHKKNDHTRLRIAPTYKLVRKNSQRA